LVIEEKHNMKGKQMECWGTNDTEQDQHNDSEYEPIPDVKYKPVFHKRIGN
jgi:hypothetical protein